MPTVRNSFDCLNVFSYEWIIPLFWPTSTPRRGPGAGVPRLVPETWSPGGGPRGAVPGLGSPGQSLGHRPLARFPRPVPRRGSCKAWPPWVAAAVRSLVLTAPSALEARRQFSLKESESISVEIQKLDSNSEIRAWRNFSSFPLQW